MSQNVRFELDHAALRALDKAAARALATTGDEMLTDIMDAQVIPLDTSNLQNDQTFVDKTRASRGEVDIVSSTPYARRLYFHPEYNFHREPWTDSRGKRHSRANAHAGAHWFAPWAQGGEKEGFAQKTFERLYKKEAGL